MKFKMANYCSWGYYIKECMILLNSILYIQSRMFISDTFKFFNMSYAFIAGLIKQIVLTASAHFYA
jgi:hypothetical protein